MGTAEVAAAMASSNSSGVRCIAISSVQRPITCYSSASRPGRAGARLTQAGLRGARRRVRLRAGPRVGVDDTVGCN